MDLATGLLIIIMAPLAPGLFILPIELQTTRSSPGAGGCSECLSRGDTIIQVRFGGGFSYLLHHYSLDQIRLKFEHPFQRHSAFWMGIMG